MATPHQGAGDAGVAYNAENRLRGNAGLTGGVEPAKTRLKSVAVALSTE